MLQSPPSSRLLSSLFIIAGSLSAASAWVSSPLSCAPLLSRPGSTLPAARSHPAPLRMAVGDSESKAEREYVLPEGARRLRMEKPLGIVFEEVADDKGAIVVQVGPGSNAERVGVKVGERLVAVSATTLRAGKEGEYAKTGHGGRPFDNFEIVMYPCKNDGFRSILKAFASNNERWGINHVSIVLEPEGDMSVDDEGSSTPAEDTAVAK